MIIESIFTWFFSVLQYSVSLLPENGSMFGNIPSLSFTALKYITLFNGYIPVKEIGATFVIMLAVYASLLVIRMIFGIYNQVTKLIP